MNSYVTVVAGLQSEQSTYQPISQANISSHEEIMMPAKAEEQKD